MPRPRETQFLRRFYRAAARSEGHCRKLLETVQVLLADGRDAAAVRTLRNLYHQQLDSADSDDEARRAEAYGFFLMVCQGLDDLWPKELVERLWHLQRGKWTDIACEALIAVTPADRKSPNAWTIEKCRRQIAKRDW